MLKINASFRILSLAKYSAQLRAILNAVPFQLFEITEATVNWQREGKNALPKRRDHLDFHERWNAPVRICAHDGRLRLYPNSSAPQRK
jgi:hypothetical protein